MTLPRREIRVPPRPRLSRARLAAQLAASTALLPVSWARAVKKGVPGAGVGARCARLGLELLSRARSPSALQQAARLVLMPMDSTRFFEFDFVERATATLSVERYLDLSSPRVVPVLQLRSRPGLVADLINPDLVDLEETRQLVTASGLTDRCRLHGRVLDAVAFEPASFDLVTCVSVLEHIPEDARVLRQAWDLLAPGGTLVLTVPVMAQACEQYIDENEYGLLPPDDRGFFFWQRFYDAALLAERVFPVTGPPAHTEVYGERVAGSFAANAEQKRRLRKWYPFWKEPLMMASEYRFFDAVDELPGEGVIGLVFVKPGASVHG